MRPLAASTEFIPSLHYADARVNSFHATGQAAYIYGWQEVKDSKGKGLYRRGCTNIPWFYAIHQDISAYFGEEQQNEEM